MVIRAKDAECAGSTADSGDLFGDKDEENECQYGHSDDKVDIFEYNEVDYGGRATSDRRRKVHWNETKALEVARGWFAQSEEMETQKGTKFWYGVCITLNQRTRKNRGLIPPGCSGKD